METGAVPARSLSKLAFGPDGILFVGDSIGARIFALDLNDRTPHSATPLEVADIETKIAGLLGADPRDTMIHDMAVNPISKNVYLTVSRGRRSFTERWQLPNDVANASALIRVTPSGAIEEVHLDQIKHSSAPIENPASETAQLDWKKSKTRVDVVSDLAYADGKLYVAGLSNEEFSSTMRIYPFPFEGAGRSTSLEIYHGSHGKYETDAPIRAFLPLRIHDKPYLVASYLCTPLVLFPVDDLQGQRRVRGTTIAELGDGNYPLDMVSLRLKNKDYLLIVNSTRGLLLVSADDLAKPLKPITTAVEEGTAGVPAEHLRNWGVLRADNYGDDALLFLIRSPLNGSAQLSTMPFDHLR